MKSGDFWRAWGGIAGVQSTLAVLLDRGHHRARRCRSNESRRCSPRSPRAASALRARAGSQPGYDADLALVDLAESWTLEAGDLLQRHRDQPVHRAAAFRGRVRRTILPRPDHFRDGRMTAERKAGSSGRNGTDMQQLGQTRSAQSRRPSSADARHVCAQPAAGHRERHGDRSRRAGAWRQVPAIHGGTSGRRHARSPRLCSGSLMFWKARCLPATAGARGRRLSSTFPPDATSTCGPECGAARGHRESLRASGTESRRPQFFTGSESAVKSEPLNGNAALQVRCLLPRRTGLRFRRQHHDLPAGRVAATWWRST